MANSTWKTDDHKPHPDFPLSVHPSGHWCKKVKGKLHYFGKVKEDPKGTTALTTWLEQKDELLAGRKPRSKSGGLTVWELTQRFLTFKKDRLDNNEIGPRMFAEYQATCERLDEQLGSNRLVIDLTPDEFQKLRANIAKTWGPVRLGNEIQRVRSVFRYATESGLIDKAILFGPGFKKPSAKTLRQNRAAKGIQLFTPKQIRALVKAADLNLRAMILLAINGGLGNTDVARMPIDALDLAAGWLNYPRPKTGMPRRIPLWPETIKELRAVVADRKDGLVFMGPKGGRYMSEAKNNQLCHSMQELCEEVGISGRTFYDLRRTFETVADNLSRDRDGVKAIMGHAPDSGDMSAVYRQNWFEDRLRGIVDKVHDWLFHADTDDGLKKT